MEKHSRLLITKQQGGVWVATVLYAKNSVIDAKNFVNSEQGEAYMAAEEWVINNIDDNAIIDPL
jgi:hypothetical protein